MSSPRQSREVVREVLPNGIRVITEHMPHVRSVSVGVWIATGSREEAEHETGISHFIEHMLFKGTRKRTAEQIARAADSIGGGLDAFTSKEIVSYNIKVLDEHLPPAFDIVADLVCNPLFGRKDIEKEKGVILEELKMETDNPEYQAHELFSKHFWKGHPLGRSILGTPRTIRSFSRDSVERFYHHVYAPANIIVTAAGNLEHRRLVHLAAKHLGDMKARPFTPAAAPPQPHASLVFRDKKNLEQVHLYVGVPSIPMPHESRFACYLLNAILGGGMSSRLFQNIREKQGLAYSIYSELALYRDAGCLFIYAGTSTRNTARVIDCILDEMYQMASTPAGAEELRRAKDHLKGSLVLSLESTSSRMANLARQETYFHRFLSIDEMLERIENVTAAEIQGLAQEFFHPRQVALAMLGPLNGFRLTRKDLVR